MSRGLGRLNRGIGLSCGLLLIGAMAIPSKSQPTLTAFVDTDRLLAALPLKVALPPAFPFAPMRLEGSWAIALSPVPIGEPIGQRAAIARWQRDWQASLEREHRFAVTPPHLPASPRLAIPGTLLRREDEPFFWERLQGQAFERARLRLRLAFSERLSPAERAALQQRLKELDEQLRSPPPPSPPPLPSPEPPDFVPPTPVPLTDVEQIAALVAPPPLLPPSSVTRLDWEEAETSWARQQPLGGTSVPRAALLALAQAFARAYGKQHGWQVVFEASPFAADKTEEVLMAWRRWWANGQ